MPHPRTGHHTERLRRAGYNNRNPFRTKALRTIKGSMAQVTCNEELIPLAEGYQRGLNVVVFDPSNGCQVQSQSFDVYANPANADAFADWIETIPQGRVVAIAAKDDASFNVTAKVLTQGRSRVRMDSGKLRNEISHFPDNLTDKSI